MRAEPLGRVVVAKEEVPVVAVEQGQAGRHTHHDVLHSPVELLGHPPVYGNPQWHPQGAARGVRMQIHGSAHDTPVPGVSRPS